MRIVFTSGSLSLWKLVRERLLSFPMGSLGTKGRFFLVSLPLIKVLLRYRFSLLQRYSRSLTISILFFLSSCLERFILSLLTSDMYSSENQLLFFECFLGNSSCMFWTLGSVLYRSLVLLNLNLLICDSLLQKLVLSYTSCSFLRGSNLLPLGYFSMRTGQKYNRQSSMANKLTQAEIDELIKDSQGSQSGYKEDFDKQVEEEYAQDYEMNQEIGENMEKEEYKIDDEPEVESEMADEILSEKFQNQSDFEFKKDEDLSEAKSEFIESSRLNEAGILKVKSNLKSPKNSKEVTKDPPNKTKPASAKTIAAPAKKEATKKPAKPEKKAQADQQANKEKLSQSQINRRMKEIEQGKKEMQKKKEEKKKKEDQLKRKEYEQAKKAEEERKEKNRKILEQQKQKKKAPVETKPINESQVKIPEKPTDFKYMDMKKQKLKNQKQIQKKIEQQNLKKLKKLNDNTKSQLKGEAKKTAILEERNYQLQREKKEKKKEEKEQDVLIIKQIKKEIMESKRFILEKTNDINRADKNIEELKKKVKEKENKIYETEVKDQNTEKQEFQDDFSDLSPIERFVYSFPESKSVQEIFQMIDTNGDGVLSSAQIHDKLTQFNLQPDIITKVEEILDENSDGTVSHEQFVFLVELQLKRQKDYKKILGELAIANPIDMQVKILDMQAKLKYINKQIDNYNNGREVNYDQKIIKLQKKADKVEEKIKKDMVDYTKQGNKEITVNTLANLTNQYVKLRNERGIKLNFLQKLRKKVKENLAEKNRLLASRVQENLRLEEQVYKLRNEIQERQLRFLSMKKIEANKRGYLQRQTQQRKELQEAHKRTKEYQIMVSDPTKKAQKLAEADELRFLAAVIMIQRNYRKKKARQQLQSLKAK